MLERVFRRKLFGVGGSVRGIGLYEFFDLLLELCFALVYWLFSCGVMSDLARIGSADVLRAGTVIRRRRRVELIEPVLLEDSELQHLLFEVVFFVLVIIGNF